MADKSGKKKLVKRVNLQVVHRLSASVALLAFFVIATAGLLAEASVMAIVYRSIGVVLIVKILTRIVVQILASYEEINSGKA